VDAAQQQHLADDRREASPKRLGDVLYADRSKRPASERDWVALVESVAAGDQAALHARYERANRVVFTLAMRISGNRETAEELTLDVFHDVWRRASRYDPADGTVLGWIMNQARSRAIDRLRFDKRKKRADDRPEDASEAPQASDCQALLEGKQRSLALREALKELKLEERRAIEVAYFSELTYAEAAARLGEPLGTVKTRIRSGLNKLRQALAREGAKP
jgi:RNA polymerase sigma-70 factor (ECF subfamily)